MPLSAQQAGLRLLPVKTGTRTEIKPAFKISEFAARSLFASLAVLPPSSLSLPHTLTHSLSSFVSLSYSLSLSLFLTQPLPLLANQLLHIYEKKKVTSVDIAWHVASLYVCVNYDFTLNVEF